MQENDTLTVNGELHSYTSGMTIASLLEEIMDTPGVVVVELNGTIIPRDLFVKTLLSADDTLEIVRFVGGG